MTQAELSARHYKRKRKSILRKRKTRRKLAKEPGRAVTQQRTDEWNAVQPTGKDGYDYRIGRCQERLSDIPPDSIALVMTDPPYGMKPEAELLYRWLAEFAERVLIPGCSLICYTGLATVERDRAIFRERPHLTLWAEPVMLHDQRQKLQGLGIYANHKPILWYVKDGFRRPAANGKVPKVPSVVRSVGDKTRHPWAQGDGGVQQWVRHLTEKGETVVDPFAGTGRWGKITCEKGRRWIGADVKEGGSTMVVV